MTLQRKIRKTAFMNYKNCEKQFWYFYNDDERYDGYGGKSSNPALQRGTDFHNAADTFFDNINGYSYEDFRAALPFGDNLHYYYDWFAKIEWTRYELLANKDYFKPLACELIVEGDVGKGHVDRIDKISETELQIVEYKTGKSYDMEKSWAPTKMNAEIGFYARLIEEGKYYPDMTIKTWKVINPTLQKQWVNKISPISLKAVDRTMLEMVEKILAPGDFRGKLDTLFPPTQTPLCGWCPYIQDCLFESNFKHD